MKCAPLTIAPQGETKQMPMTSGISQTWVEGGSWLQLHRPKLKKVRAACCPHDKCLLPSLTLWSRFNREELVEAHVKPRWLYLERKVARSQLRSPCNKRPQTRSGYRPCGTHPSTKEAPGAPAAPTSRWQHPNIGEGGPELCWFGVVGDAAEIWIHPYRPALDGWAFRSGYDCRELPLLWSGCRLCGPHLQSEEALGALEAPERCGQHPKMREGESNIGGLLLAGEEGWYWTSPSRKKMDGGLVVLSGLLGFSACGTGWSVIKSWQGAGTKRSSPCTHRSNFQHRPDFWHRLSSGAGSTTRHAILERHHVNEDSNCSLECAHGPKRKHSGRLAVSHAVHMTWNARVNDIFSRLHFYSTPGIRTVMDCPN